MSEGMIKGAQVIIQSDVDELIITDLNLRTPIYQQVAAYGHFGRNDLNLPWENLNKLVSITKDIKL